MTQAHPAENEDLWRGLLSGDDSPIKHDRGRYRRFPGRPRCKTCLVPLGGPAASFVRLITRRAPSSKNPNYCNLCDEFVRTHPGGAEIEIALLFADVRGSTTLAETMSPRDFTRMMNRFYGAANRVLIDSDALVDKLVGDEVIGLYLPFLGPARVRMAIDAARKLLEATGHEDDSEPWIPVGAGVHAGLAYVGAVGTQDTVADFTALGDAVNVAARLASLAKSGEVLISEEAHDVSGLDLTDLPVRRLELRGRRAPIEVRVDLIGRRRDVISTDDASTA
jgi:adenylate cyclase